MVNLRPPCPRRAAPHQELQSGRCRGGPLRRSLASSGLLLWVLWAGGEPLSGSFGCIDLLGSELVRRSDEVVCRGAHVPSALYHRTSALHRQLLPHRQFVPRFILMHIMQTGEKKTLAKQSGHGVSNAARIEAKTFHLGERKSFCAGST